MKYLSALTDINKLRQLLVSVVEAALVILVCAVLCIGSEFFWPCALALPIPVIYTGVRYSRVKAAALGAAAIGSYMFMGWQATAMVAAWIVPAAALSIMSFAQKKSTIYTVSMCVTGYFLSMLLAVSCASLIEDVNFSMEIFKVFGEAIENSNVLAAGMYTLLRIPELITGNIGFADVFAASHQQMLEYLFRPEQIASVEQTIQLYLPTTIIDGVLVLGILSYAIANEPLRRRGISANKPFSEWVLPSAATKHFIVLYILGAVPYVFQISSLTLPAYVLIGFMGSVMSVQGLSLLDFILKCKVEKQAVRVMVILISAVLLPGVMMVAGMADQVFRIREKYHRKRECIQQGGK